MLAASVVILTLAAYVWRQSTGRVMRTFSLILFATTIWVVSMAGWSFSPTANIALIWFRIQFIGVSAVPVLLFLYAGTAGGQRMAFPPRVLMLLWLLPVLTIIVALGPLFQPLLFERVVFAHERDAMLLKAWSPGPWFFLHSSYSFGLVAASLWTLARLVIRSHGLFRRQLTLLLIAIIPAIVLSALNTIQLLPPDQLATPLGFLLMGLVIVWSIMRHRLISVVPIARDLLIEQMEDGMLVLDRGSRIVDLNPAMQAILGASREHMLGIPLDEAPGVWPDLRQRLRGPRQSEPEELFHPDGLRQFELQRRALAVEGHPIGDLFVLHDISRLKKVQRDLFTLATTDTLTGLSTRRQFYELARAQIAVAAREGATIAALLIDIDHFKRVNDRYGHAAGDYVLAAVAQRISASLRRADVICRYGGEEFAALLSNTDRALALAIGERVRAMVGVEPVALEEEPLVVTISVGVALGVAGAVELDDLVRQADQALYKAKEAGRDRVMLFVPGSEGG